MSARSVIIKDEDGVTAAIEDLTGGQLVSTLSSAALNSGRAFVSNTYDADVAGAATVEVLMVSDADALIYAVLSGDVTLDARLQVFEGTTVSDNGTPLSRLSRNRQTPSVAQGETYRDPVITDDGTELLDTVISAGQKSSVVSFGLGSSQWVMKKATNYLLRMTNIAGAPQPISTFIAWDEYSDPPGVRVN